MLDGSIFDVAAMFQQTGGFQCGADKGELERFRLGPECGKTLTYEFAVPKILRRCIESFNLECFFAEAFHPVRYDGDECMGSENLNNVIHFRPPHGTIETHKGSGSGEQQKDQPSTRADQAGKLETSQHRLLCYEFDNGPTETESSFKHEQFGWCK
uniref:Uncharacterized protein n=1 Tax=Anopheles coluzzii TaxID=1518534 RepID=A0A8W7P3N1_ANOCL